MSFEQDFKQYCDLNGERINNELLKNAIGYIKENYQKSFTLDQMCSFCNVSKQHLIRCFNAAFGISPMAFVTQCKIFKACGLLRETTYTVKEIGYMLGFDNQCHFSKVFKRIVCQTPTQYRAKERLSI